MTDDVSQRSAEAQPNRDPGPSLNFDLDFPVPGETTPFAPIGPSVEAEAPPATYIGTTGLSPMTGSLSANMVSADADSSAELFNTLFDMDLGDLMWWDADALFTGTRQ